MKFTLKHLTFSALTLFALSGGPLLGSAKTNSTHEPTTADRMTAADYVGRQYVLGAGHIYTPSTTGNAFEILPLWQDEVVTLTEMERLPTGWRLWLTTEAGVLGYLEVATLGMLCDYLCPLSSCNQPLHG